MTNSALIQNYLNNGGIIRVIPAKRRKGYTMPRVAQPPKRNAAQAYRFAVQWIGVELASPEISFNDMLSDTHAMLLAETFEKPIQYVCADIIAARQQATAS